MCKHKKMLTRVCTHTYVEACTHSDRKAHSIMSQVPTVQKGLVISGCQ
uniref:Uncharacterized protein n=1 Tax=Anguilla anguilla TaxID=7936 RepID=A0A0E9TQU9_ANGAN